MTNGKRLRCSGIGTGSIQSRKCVKAETRMRSLTGKIIRTIGEYYTVPGLPYDLVIGNDILKPNRVNIQWGDPDLAVIGDRGSIPLKVTKIPKISTKLLESSLPVLPIKTKTLRPPRRRKVNVCTITATVLTIGMGQNVPIKHDL